MSSLVEVRPIRICLTIDSEQIVGSIKAVMPLVLDEHRFDYVNNVADADLVLFTDVREVEHGYDRAKTYAYLKVGEKKPTLPENCVVIEVTSILPGLVTAAAESCKKLAPAVAKPALKVKKAARPDALRVLVIEDEKKNVYSAKAGLSWHRLTIATGYEEAMNILADNKFDVVLSDLHLPMSSTSMGEKFELGKLVPYGILLMMEAARQGAKYVAVVTDLSHHDDAFSAAFDHFSRFPMKIENAKVVMMHAPINHLDNSKDWVTALERLMKD